MTRRRKQNRQATPGGRKTPVLSDGETRSRDDVLSDFRKIVAPQRDRDQDPKAKP